MPPERKCPRCGSYALDGGSDGSALRCRRCDHILAPAGAYARFQLGEARSRQWRRVCRWLWPGAVLLYSGIVALFQQGPPWTLTTGLGDWLLLWLIIGLFGVPATYFLLLLVAGAVFNWTIRARPQRLLGVVGVLRGCGLALLASWPYLIPGAGGGAPAALLAVGMVGGLLGLLLLGPPASREGMDILAGLMVALVVVALLLTRSGPLAHGDGGPSCPYGAQVPCLDTSHTSPL
jgi:hypothetical protein